MHERVEVDVSAWLLAVVIVVLVSLGLLHQLKLQAARQVEVRKIQEILAAESERAEEEAKVEYTSMFANQSLCAVCDSPTTSRCSRCKVVHYCSSSCQLNHWRQGHKDECRSSKASKDAPSISLAVSGSRRLENRTDIAYVSNPLHVGSKRPTVLTSDVRMERITSDGCLAKPRRILFPYDRFVKYFNWDIRNPPCGLINCGNSCFANVILQCLTYTRPLAAFLLEGSHRPECRRNEWCFMCELQEHAWRSFNSQVPFSPIRILSRLRNIGSHMGYGRQEDAHEFMRFAVDSMQSTCLDEYGGEKAVDPRSQETTLLQYIFGGHLQSQVKCMDCGHESNRYENMMDLAVEIQGAVESLEDALAQFTAPEWLDGENKYQCDRCNAYVKASKRLTIHEAPNILTIALKRFQSGKFGKINKRVSFPEALNMSPYMSGEGDAPPLYRLYAVVVHVDMLNASFFGHYICYVRDMEGTWYKIDDSKVKEVDLEKVMSQKAYMLMYSRSTARPSPEVDTGSVASSLMDVSMAGKECSSLPFKYQRVSSVEQFHDEIHRISPIVAGTVVDDRLIEDFSTGQSSAIGESSTSFETETIYSPVADNLSASEKDLQNGSGDPEGRKNLGKRRLEVEEGDISLPRNRSSSCPPVARSLSASFAAYQLADDLPRTFGYSLCTRDREQSTSGASEATPLSKKPHLVEDMEQDMMATGLGTGEDSNGSMVQANGFHSVFESQQQPEQEQQQYQPQLEQEQQQYQPQQEQLEEQQEEQQQPLHASPLKDSKIKSSSKPVERARPLFTKGFLNRPKAVPNGCILKVPSADLEQREAKLPFVS